MIDIKALEKALAHIGKIGQGELTIEVDNLDVTLRVLTADEDMDAQRYSRTPDNEGEEQVEGLNLLERYKRSLLAYAIVQIGNLDLRNEPYIATGEVTEKGVPVRKPRHVVVRSIIDGWARVTTMLLFQKYLELQRRVDAEAEKAIRFDVKDLDTEIARVEKRLEELKQSRERVNVVRDAGATASSVAATSLRHQEQLATVQAVAAGATLEPEPEPVSEPEPEPETERPPVPVVRQRAGPTVGAPPIPPAMRAPPQRPTPAASPSPAPSSFEEMQDSMGDGSDSIANETARLLAARQASRRTSLDAAVAEDPPFIDAPTRRAPPHREAANLTDAVLDMEAGSVRAARVGGANPNAALRMEPAPITRQVRGAPSEPEPSKSLNPRFHKP